MPITWPVRGSLIGAPAQVHGGGCAGNARRRRSAPRDGTPAPCRSRWCPPRSHSRTHLRRIRGGPRGRAPAATQIATAPAARVGDHQDVLAVVDHRLQSARDVVENGKQPRRLAQHVESAGVDIGRRVMFGVNTLAHQPVPGFRDHLTRSGRRAIARHRRVVHRRQEPGILPRVVTDRDRGLRNSGTGHHSDCAPRHITTPRGLRSSDRRAPHLGAA